jgi:hypothetical protein
VEVLGSRTIDLRLQYWRVATGIVQEYPIFGVGLDAFGDFFGRFRDTKVINSIGLNQQADAVHNVPLDYFVSGGLPLGFIYLFVNIYPFVVGLLKFRKTRTNLSFTILLLSMWIGYQVQAIVSINQLGIAVWQWIILGLLVNSNPRASGNGASIKPDPLPRNSERIRGALLITQKLTTLILVFLSMCLAWMSFSREMDFLEMARIGNGSQLVKISEEFPQDSRRIALIAIGLSKAGQDSESLKVLRVGIAHNPNFSLFWKLAIENPLVKGEELLKAKLEFNKLSPSP